MRSVWRASGTKHCGSKKKRKQTKEIGKEISTRRKNQNIFSRTDRPDWRKRTNNIVHQYPKREVQQYCPVSTSPVCKIKAGCGEIRYDRWRRAYDGSRGKRSQHANVYGGQECGGKTYVSSSVTLVSSSTGTKKENIQFIDQMSSKRKGLSVAKNMKGAHAKHEKQKDQTNRKCQHKADPSSSQQESVARAQL